MNIKYLSLACGTLLSIGFTGIAAETTAGPGPAQPAPVPENPVIVLSPFEVNTSSDVGWIANGTLLANRTNQPLKDVPVTVDALTKEFMQDVGAFNDFEAAQWVPNVQVADETGRSDFGRYSFRGIANQWGTNRNFFRWYVPNDGYNIERIDFGRGSNSLIFGDNEPGGQATVYTKRAVIGRTFTRMLGQLGSYDGHRAEFDHNQKLGKKVALRLNATDSSEGRFFEWNKFDFRGMHGTVTYQPAANTLLRAEAEIGGHERIWGDNNHFIQEKAAAGLGFNSRYTVLPNGTLLDNTTIADGAALPGGVVWNTARDKSDASGSSLALLDRDIRTVGGNTFKGFSKSTNWGGPANVENRHYTTFTVYLEQRITPDCAVELAFNQQKQWRDATSVSNTYLSKVDFIGRRYFDAIWNEAREDNTVQTVRGMASYNFHRLDWMKQLFVVTGESRKDQYKNQAETLRWLNAPGVTSTTNLSGTGVQPVFRFYQDDANSYPVTKEHIIATAPAGTRPFVTTMQGQQHVSKAYAISVSGQYWKGRFQTLLGLRYDENDTADSAAWLAANRTPQLEYQWSGTKGEHGDHWRYNPAYHHRKATHNLGFTYSINQAINFYAMNSSSFRWQGAANFVNGYTKPILGETTEYGLKSAFFQNQLQWNLTWYTLVRENVRADFDRNGVSDVQLQNALNTGIEPGAPGYLVIRANSSADTRTQHSRGWETSFVFSPTKGLSVRVGGALIDVTQTDAFPVINEALRNAEARKPTDPAVLATINQLRAGLNTSGADGTRLTGAGATPFSFNYALEYRLGKNTKLDGASIGLNGSYKDDFVLGYFGKYPDAVQVKGGEQIVVNGSLGYKHRMMGYPVEMRLNVFNLIAPEYRETGLVTYASGTNYMKRIYYGTPMSARFTVSTKF